MHIRLEIQRTETDMWEILINGQSEAVRKNHIDAIIQAKTLKRGMQLAGGLVYVAPESEFFGHI